MIRQAAMGLAAVLSLAACHSAPDRPRPSPALWEVTGPHGERGWLFGTIHSLADGTRWETPAIDAALGKAGVLVVEVANLSDSNAGKAAFAAVSHSLGLPPLLERAAPAERPELAATLRRAHLDAADFAQVETWAAALVIANAQDPAKSENGVDRALLDRRLPVLGLEGFAEQFAIFDHLPQAQQAALLHFAAAPAAANDDARLTAAWIKGDLETLDSEMTGSELSDAGLRQALLVQRNRAWAARIGALLRQGKRPFVAVGAGHMLEDVGLPTLLAAQGFAVRRIE